MYKFKKGIRRGTIKNQKGLKDGESIEQKVQRITQNKEPITDGAPEIFTERKDGVLAGYNPRTDRFELAVDAMDYVQRSKTAKSLELAKQQDVKDAKVIDLDTEKGNSKSSQQ